MTAEGRTAHPHSLAITLTRALEAEADALTLAELADLRAGDEDRATPEWRRWAARQRARREQT